VSATIALKAEYQAVIKVHAVLFAYTETPTLRKLKIKDKR